MGSRPRATKGFLSNVKTSPSTLLQVSAYRCSITAMPTVTTHRARIAHVSSTYRCLECGVEWTVIPERPTRTRKRSIKGWYLCPNGCNADVQNYYQARAETGTSAVAREMQIQVDTLGAAEAAELGYTTLEGSDA